MAPSVATAETVMATVITKTRHSTISTTSGQPPTKRGTLSSSKHCDSSPPGTMTESPGSCDDHRPVPRTRNAPRRRTPAFQDCPSPHGVWGSGRLYLRPRFDSRGCRWPARTTSPARALVRARRRDCGPWVLAYVGMDLEAGWHPLVVPAACTFAQVESQTPARPGSYRMSTSSTRSGSAERPRGVRSGSKSLGYREAA
jgi:hypothetical protein